MNRLLSVVAGVAIVVGAVLIVAGLANFDPRIGMVAGGVALILMGWLIGES